MTRFIQWGIIKACLVLGRESKKQNKRKTATSSIISNIIEMIFGSVKPLGTEPKMNRSNCVDVLSRAIWKNKELSDQKFSLFCHFLIFCEVDKKEMGT